MMRIERLERLALALLAAGGALAANAPSAQEPGAREPVTERGADQTPLSDRDAAAERDVAVPGEDERNVAERVEEATGRVERREEITRMADAALARLRAEKPSAGALLDRAYGHAVFDTTKGGLIVTGAGGTGVAREAASGDATFMRVGAGGLGVGGGFESYKLVMLFEDAATYESFVAGRWDGSISAQAAAGGEGAAAEEQFVGGIRVFRLSDGGFIAQVDLSGMRFWPSEDLNLAQLEE